MSLLFVGKQTNCPQLALNIVIWILQSDDQNVFLIHTVHVSKESAGNVLGGKTNRLLSANLDKALRISIISIIVILILILISVS